MWGKGCYRNLNSEPWACQASSLPLEPCLWPKIYLFYFRFSRILCFLESKEYSHYYMWSHKLLIFTEEDQAVNDKAIFNKAKASLKNNCVQFLGRMCSETRQVRAKRATYFLLLLLLLPLCLINCSRTHSVEDYVAFPHLSLGIRACFAFACSTPCLFHSWVL